MAETFLHPTKEKPFVNHIDGNKLNNNLENLEMCNNSENVQHAYDNGLYKDRRECHPVSVYDGETTRNFKSLREAERMIGISRRKIASILKGELPNYTKFKFKYL